MSSWRSDARPTPIGTPASRCVLLLRFLNGLGVLPVEEPVAPTPNELVVAGFERYLVTERGLLPRTAAAQAARVRRFQIHLHADLTIKENAIAKITPQDTATAGPYQPSDPAHRRAAGLARHNQVRGITAADLVGVLGPQVAGLAQHRGRHGRGPPIA